MSSGNRERNEKQIMILSSKAAIHPGVNKSMQRRKPQAARGGGGGGEGTGIPVLR